MNSLLKALASYPNTTVSDVEGRLRVLLQADSVKLKFVGGTKRHYDANAAGNLLKYDVEMQVIFTPDQNHLEQPSAQSPAAIPQPPGAPPVPASKVSPEIERFIRDMDALERRPNSFIWINFLLRDRIPQLGIPVADASSFLNSLQTQGIVMAGKRPNPSNPDFPTTVINLNRSHPIVQALLHTAEKGIAPKKFTPITMPGGSLAEELIRDRR